MSISALGFYLVSLVVIVAAISAVTSRQLLNAALSLALSFFAIGGLYALIGTPFLFIMQILINAGAIPIVTVFIIMMTQSRQVTLWRPSLLYYFAVLVAFVVVAVRYVGQIGTFQAAVGPSPATINPVSSAQIGQTMLSSPETLGRAGTLLAFEAASVILLVAMIGAIVLARREGETIKGEVGMLTDGETPVRSGQSPILAPVGQGVAPMPRPAAPVVAVSRAGEGAD